MLEIFLIYSQCTKRTNLIYSQCTKRTNLNFVDKNFLIDEPTKLLRVLFRRNYLQKFWLPSTRILAEERCLSESWTTSERHEDSPDQRDHSACLFLVLWLIAVGQYIDRFHNRALQNIKLVQKFLHPRWLNANQSCYHPKQPLRYKLGQTSDTLCKTVSTGSFPPYLATWPGLNSFKIGLVRQMPFRTCAACSPKHKPSDCKIILYHGLHIPYQTASHMEPHPHLRVAISLGLVMQDEVTMLQIAKYMYLWYQCIIVLSRYTTISSTISYNYIPSLHLKHGRGPARLRYRGNAYPTHNSQVVHHATY